MFRELLILCGATMVDIIIRRLRPEDKPEWLRMRHLLWPGHSDAEMLTEMDAIMEPSKLCSIFLISILPRYIYFLILTFSLFDRFL